MLPIVFAASAFALMLLWSAPIPEHISSGNSPKDAQQMWDIARFAISIFVITANMMFANLGLRWVFRGGL